MTVVVQSITLSVDLWRAMRWEWKNWSELNTGDLYALMALRQAVFVVEQDCPYLDADGQDEQAYHLLGWEGAHLAAYARAFAPGVVCAEAAIGRVVTSVRIRGTGQGRPLMQEAIRCVRETWGAEPIKLSAQAHLEVMGS